MSSTTSSFSLLLRDSGCDDGCDDDDIRNDIRFRLTTKAQKLNNQGSSYLLIKEKQDYDRAITILTKALQISEKALQLATTNSSSNQSTSSCCTTTLDGCMSVSSSSLSSSSSSRTQQDEEKNEDENSNSNSSSSSSSFFFNGDGDDYDDDSDGCYYIYTKPIYCVCQDMKGVTLSLIIMFNLALALQLSAFNEYFNNSTRQEGSLLFSQTDILYEKLQKSSKLYEIVCQLQNENNSNNTSLRFSIVVANNLGQIHRLLLFEDLTKQHQHQEYYTNCMQYVLTMMIYKIDQSRRSTSSTESSTFFFESSEIVDGLLGNATRCLIFNNNTRSGNNRNISICANAA